MKFAWDENRRTLMMKKDNIFSSNGLVYSGNDWSTELILNQLNDIIWRYHTTAS